MRRFGTFLIGCIIGLAPVSADELKIASWNIANLGEPGSSLRGYERSDADYDEIAAIIQSLDADVIALQEIGSIPAAQRILGDDYQVHFETRCLENEQQCLGFVEDIYTAIAVRNSISKQANVFYVDELAIDHEDACGEKRAVRGGVGVRLDVAGTQTWIPSLHLKATCKDDRIEDGTEQDCATQRKQFELLADWVAARPEGDAVVLAGDFNRKLLNSADSIRNEVFIAADADTRFLPVAQRQCWADHQYDFSALAQEARDNNPKFEQQGLRPWIYQPKSNAEIDFFILSGLDEALIGEVEQVRFGDATRFFGTGDAIEDCDGKIVAFDDGERALTFGNAFPSDHCPIVLNLKP